MEHESVTAYKAALAKVIEDGGLSNLTGDVWLPLKDLITQEVCHAAFLAGEQVHYPAGSIDFTDAEGRQVTATYPEAVLVRRTEKTMARIKEKLAMVDRPDLLFKTNCDLMAFRTFCCPIAIATRTETLEQINKHEGNAVHVRGSVKDKETGKPTDIIQYMYVYHKDLGFLAEYQIGHPFAPWKFMHDSGIRDGKPGSIDFSKAKVHVYKLVKANLLDPVEGFDYATVWRDGFETEPPAEYLELFA